MPHIQGTTKKRSTGVVKPKLSLRWWAFDEAHVVGRFHAGEELPRCWLDPNYQRLND